MKAHPEIRKALQGEKKVGHAYGKLKESNPDLANKLSQARESWKTCSQNNEGKPEKNLCKIIQK